MAKMKKCKFCQSEIDAKAKVCPVCKRPLKTHGCLISIVFLLFIIAGGLFCLVQFTQPADDQYITLDEYKEIQTGMTYEEVQEIVGSAGTISSQSEVGGISTFIVMWYANPSTGTNADVTFQNNQVIAKAQIGLK